MARSTDRLKPAENLAFPHKRLVSIATAPAITCTHGGVVAQASRARRPRLHFRRSRALKCGGAALLGPRRAHCWRYDGDPQVRGWSGGLLFA